MSIMRLVTAGEAREFTWSVSKLTSTKPLKSGKADSWAEAYKAGGKAREKLGDESLVISVVDSPA